MHLLQHGMEVQSHPLVKLVVCIVIGQHPCPGRDDCVAVILAAALILHRQSKGDIPFRFPARELHQRQKAFIGGQRPIGTQDAFVAKLGPEASAVSSEQRSQYQNRRAAVQRLETMLQRAMVVPRRRVATKPTLGSKKRRLEDKRQQSERKANRQRPPRDHD